MQTTPPPLKMEGDVLRAYQERQAVLEKDLADCKALNKLQLDRLNAMALQNTHLQTQLDTIPLQWRNHFKANAAKPQRAKSETSPPPLEPTLSVGVVECPKCKQKFEVVK